MQSKNNIVYFFPPCQVKVESDPAKLICGNSISDTEDIDVKNLPRNQIRDSWRKAHMWSFYLF